MLKNVINKRIAVIIPIRIHYIMDENQLKIFRKWVKICKKLGLVSAKCGQFEYTAAEKSEKKMRTSKKDSGVEGLVNDPSAAMPPDSEMLLYSTPYFDAIRNSRKDPTPR